MPAGPLPKEIISSEKIKKKSLFYYYYFLWGGGERERADPCFEGFTGNPKSCIILQNDGKHSGVPIYFNIKAYIKQ